MSYSQSICLCCCRSICTIRPHRHHIEWHCTNQQETSTLNETQPDQRPPTSTSRVKTVPSVIDDSLSLSLLRFPTMYHDSRLVCRCRYSAIPAITRSLSPLLLLLLLCLQLGKRAPPRDQRRYRHAEAIRALELARLHLLLDRNGRRVRVRSVRGIVLPLRVRRHNVLPRNLWESLGARVLMMAVESRLLTGRQIVFESPLGAVRQRR